MTLRTALSSVATFAIVPLLVVGCAVDPTDTNGPNEPTGSDPTNQAPLTPGDPVSPATDSDGCIDFDGDGYGIGAGCLGEDCDDTNAGISPAQTLDNTCNGIDNDCDGEIDEDLEDAALLGTVCGTGVCGTGIMVCAADGRHVVCDTWGAAGPEVCNGLDDDCDGEIDEDFADTILAEPCGEGQCAGHRVCTPDGVVCSGANLATEEVCDGVDNDCDGQVDEDATAPAEPCERTNEHGACSQSWVCEEGQWYCDAQEPSEELCDGEDNDCDGQVDEGFVYDGAVFPDDEGKAVGEACGDVGICHEGVIECVSEREVGCSTESMAIPETCDGRDNDCDGDVDEDFPALSSPCILADGECPGSVGVWSCNEDYGYEMTCTCPVGDDD